MLLAGHNLIGQPHIYLSATCSCQLHLNALWQSKKHDAMFTPVIIVGYLACKLNNVYIKSTKTEFEIVTISGITDRALKPNHITAYMMGWWPPTWQRVALHPLFF